MVSFESTRNAILFHSINERDEILKHSSNSLKWHDILTSQVNHAVLYELVYVIA